jgi:serine/threonine-protein kinase
VLVNDAPTVAVGGAPSTAIDHGRFLPGTIIHKRYRIVGRIGQGGMGEVYRADDLTLEQTVALKFLPEALSKNEQRLQRFLSEVRIARQVAHANVCRVYDIGEVDGHTYLSMEFVDGEDLASLLRRIGRLPRDKAIEIARQLCSGLFAAHDRGVLHRDLKPMNVMVDGRGHVRITDFGLAVLEDDLDRSDARAGTPAYMSPEQLAGEPVSLQSDIYSTGLVLYEIFTGKRAYEARTIPELTKLHSQGSLTNPSRIVEDIDPAVERIILHCLERDPQDRPKSALVISAALPGGDPLAAALAAGETPSPELVAASMRAEGVPPMVGLACLIVILCGLFALPTLSNYVQLHSFLPLEKSPEVLAFNARQMLAAAGHLSAPRDKAYGFHVAHDYLQWIETNDKEISRWNELVVGAPPAMSFWYRESPAYMSAVDESGLITDDLPAMTLTGMARVELDPQGRLMELCIIPPRRDLLYENDRPILWDALLAAAGVSKLNDLRPVTPEHVPPVYCDERRAWEGVLAHASDDSVRIEVASYRGRPVWFQTVYEPEVSWAAGPAATMARDTADLFQGLVFVGALAGALVLARRNLKMRRSDRKGAARVASFVAIAFMASWVLRAHHVPLFREQLELATAAIGRALFVGAASWIFYIALEPHLRRRWPDMLIAWNRLLAGRLRDRLIGRDIIIGGLFGLFAMVLTGARHFGPGWLGFPPPRPATVPSLTFLGLRYELNELINIVTSALFQPMALLVVLLLFLVVLRHRHTALIAFYLTLTTAATALSIQDGGSLIVVAAYYALLVGALIFVLIRFGLLALMIAVFYMLLLTHYPITADLSSWYAGTSMLALGIAAGLAIYGFSVSVAGRPVLHGDWARA